MYEVAIMFREWWYSFKKDIPQMRKPFIILFCIYMVALSSLFRANYNYMDDLGRTAWGYLIWDAFSRYITQFLAVFVHADTTLNDISPLPQILGVVVIVASSLVLLKVYVKKYNLLSIIAVVPVGLSPFFLECFSYKFDSPYMAVSVFVSMIPLLFIDCQTKLYHAVLAIGTIIMLLTYQASSGIFMVCLVFLMALRWNRGIDGKECIRLIVTSGMVQLVVALLFKFFLVKEYNSYVSTDVLTSQNFLSTILGNITKYYKTIWSYSTLPWKVMTLGVIAAAVRTFLMDSKRDKIKASIVVIIIVLACSILSYGAYIALQKPLFSPRALYGFGVLIALIGIIAVSGKTENIMGKIACIMLSWSMIVFSLAYGNALAEQKRFETFRMQMVLHDVSKIPELNKDNIRKLQLKGSVGYSPVIQRMEYKYPILRALVNIQMKSGFCFGEFYLFNYFSLPGVEQERNWGKKKYTIDDSSMPVFIDTAYHTIKYDDKSIVVFLKDEKIKYRTFYQE